MLCALAALLALSVAAFFVACGGGGDEGGGTADKEYYTFTVKDKDVTVTAELGTYAEKLTDSFLSWDEKAPSQVIPAAEAPLSPSFGIPFKFSFDEMIFINESKSGIQTGLHN